MTPRLRSAALEDHDAILALMVEVIRGSLPAAHHAGTIDNVTANLGFWRAALGFETRESTKRLPPGFRPMRYRLAAPAP